MNMILLIFVCLLVLKLVVGMVLDVINLRYAKAQFDEVPETFRDFMDLETYQKSINYTGAKARFGMINEVYDALILLLVVVTGLLPWIYDSLSGLLGYGIWGQSGVFLLTVMILGLPSVPFEWWSTFKLEEKFGFNKSSIGLWISDKLKGFVLTIAIGLPLMALLMFLVESAGALWWVWGFCLIFGFQLVMMVAAPVIILPLFNKFEPMKDEVLKKRLLELGDRTGFKAQTILQVDGSKRSGHSNAYFTGFGKFRKIVLYDTLLEHSTPEEIEAVLAHEIGHYKKGHIPKTIALSGVTLLIMFGLIGWLAGSPWFVESFYFAGDAIGQLAPVILVFLLTSGVVTFWISPLTSRLSRKHEYEADRFALDAMGSAEPLVSALRGLHKENLSNLTPHPLYSGFYYSHPTLLEREAAMLKD